MGNAPPIIDTIPAGMPFSYFINNWMRLDKGPRIAPRMIDLALSGAELDGTPIYDVPWNAVGAHQHAMAGLNPDPLEVTLRAAALAGVCGLCVYFALDPFKPQKKSRHNAPGRVSEGRVIYKHPPFAT